MKLSTEDRDDLFKYIRYFALKASQIIVSSRSGQKDSTPCRKRSDWFNLNISDIPGLLLAAKKNVSNKINFGCPVCVEIFLQTPDDEKMVLETWCICLLPEQSDPSPKITHTVYNQMGILLKSLVSVTRVIPAYKLSQRQEPETFTIYFRMYEKEPEIHALGEGCKQVRIGQICTPVGTLQLSVAYRVKITFSPTRSSSWQSSMLVKSNHFNTNLCPKVNRDQGDEKQKRKSQPVKAAFVDPRPPRTKEPLAPFKPGGVLWNPKLYYAIVEGQEPTSIEEKDEIINTKETKIGSPNVKTEDTSPISSPKSGNEENRIRTPSVNSDELIMSDKSSSNENMSMIMKFGRQSSRRIGKAVNYPFASPTPKSELVNFYRECVHAPPPVSLSETKSSIKDITEQLVAFEIKAKEFDEMVKSLCDSPDSDN